jgi:hypothetical protein
VRLWFVNGLLTGVLLVLLANIGLRLVRDRPATAPLAPPAPTPPAAVAAGQLAAPAWARGRARGSRRARSALSTRSWSSASGMRVIAGPPPRAGRRR